jgi:restriction system protein
MPPDELLRSIDRLISEIAEIPKKRSYWLVRTQAGEYYSTFLKNRFVAIEHEKIGLGEINKIFEKNKQNKKGSLEDLKKLSKEKYPEDRYGLIASQIMNFVVELKKDDVVIIPSYNSEIIAIGEIVSSAIPELTAQQLADTECTYRKRKRVKWIKQIWRDELDPFLYRMLQAHQAINNISHYGDIVERTVGNFYIRNSEANLVLQVNEQFNINAKQLFGLGYNLLDYSQDFFDSLNLDLSTEDIQVKITLNSKGKIQLKSGNLRTLWIIAVLAIAVNGGGLKINAGPFKLDLSTEGIIKKIIDYQNNKHDREKVDSLMKNMDSLKITSPTDAVKMIQQFSTNKEQPKK